MSVAPSTRIIFIAALALAASAPALAQQGEHSQREERSQHEEHHGGRPEAHGEAYQGPRGYQRLEEPHGWNTRPATVDHQAYEHNFQAQRVYRVGVYHRPRGWVARRWAYGQVLPRAYWAAPYILADYWLFGLEVPPVGYEWVRDDTDAILVNVSTGQILQVEYGVFG
jgi:Ni/Co efflux regulator RcnB